MTCSLCERPLFHDEIRGLCRSCWITQKVREQRIYGLVCKTGALGLFQIRRIQQQLRTMTLACSR